MPLNEPSSPTFEARWDLDRPLRPHITSQGRCPEAIDALRRPIGDTMKSLTRPISNHTIAPKSLYRLVGLGVIVFAGAACGTAPEQDIETDSVRLNAQACTVAGDVVDPTPSPTPPPGEDPPRSNLPTCGSLDSRACDPGLYGPEAACRIWGYETIICGCVCESDGVYRYQCPVESPPPPPPNCNANEVLCANRCVDLSDDQNNCGRCGNVCRSFEICDRGRCEDVFN